MDVAEMKWILGKDEREEQEILLEFIRSLGGHEKMLLLGFFEGQGVWKWCTKESMPDLYRRSHEAKKPLEGIGAMTQTNS